VTSTTAVQYTAEPRTVTLPARWTPGPRLRRFGRTLRYVFSGTVAAATDLDTVAGPMARRTLGSR
jgi:hypothetical protein